MSGLGSKKTRLILAGAFGLTVVFFVLAQKHYLKLTASDGAFETASYQHHRMLRFAFELSNNTANAVPKATFSSYLPIEIMSNQHSKAIQSAQKFTQENGELGNAVAHFELGLIPPYGKKIVKFIAEVKTAESSNRSELNDASRYLVEEPYIEINHPTVKALANRLKGETPASSVENIYHWAANQIQYAGYVSQDKGALQAIETKVGDCTEYMYTVVALARALGIPARGIGGYVYEKDMVVSPTDYHNWAEVYLGDRWQIVDAQNRAFMDDSENYIAMRILSDASASLLGSSHRFSVAENLAVKMN